MGVATWQVVSAWLGHESFTFGRVTVMCALPAAPANLEAQTWEALLMGASASWRGREAKLSELTAR